MGGRYVLFYRLQLKEQETRRPSPQSRHEPCAVDGGALHLIRTAIFPGRLP